MSSFDVHGIATAPDASAKLLQQAEKSFGFVQNLLGVLAESPAALEAYLTLNRIFDKSSLPLVERQVAILAISRYNECDYCVAAHSAIALGQQVPVDVVRAVRDDQPIADARLEALRRFTTAVIDKRGWVSEEDIAAFRFAGITRAQALEVILAIGLKTLSNYTNHVAETPLDDAFAGHAWKPFSAPAA